MIDPVSLAVGGGLLAVGILSGHAMRPKPPAPPPGPVCTCEHGYGHHEQGGKCQAQIKRAIQWSNLGVHEVDFKWVVCPCLSYDGPEPLPRVWTP